jgi:hypothetical protein
VKLACALLLLPACGFGAPSIDRVDGAPADSAAPRCEPGATWEQGLQPARTLHVSTAAGPGAPDGSEQNPFLTLRDALVAAGPGTRISLAPGTYAGATATGVVGTAAAPIWIEGPPAAGMRATLTGASGLHLIGARYVVIRHLDFTSVMSAAINLDDGTPPVPGSAHHVVIDDVAMSSIAGAGVQLTGVDDVVIRDSRMASCNRAVMMVGVHRATVARVASASTTTAGVAMAGGSEDIEVRESRVESTNIGIWIGGDSDVGQFRPPLTLPTGNFEARNIRVFNNVVRAADNAVVCTNCTESLVAHNLIRDANQSVFRLVQAHTLLGGFGFAPAGKVTYVNNAIEVAGTPTPMLAGAGTDGPSCRFSHNLWRRATPWTPALPSAETMGVYDRASGYDDAGTLCAGAGGAAAGAGTPVTEVDGTLTGACRPSPPSIGPGEPDPGC